MRRFLPGLILVIGCLHCHSSKSGSTGASVTSRITVRGDGAAPRALDATRSADGRTRESRNAPVSRVLNPNTAAAAVNGGLSSLQYYIRAISLCQTVTLQGTGTSASDGCVNLYNGPQDTTLFPNTGAGDSPDYVAMAAHARTVGTASASASGAGYGYIDLLDAGSRSALQTTRTFNAQDVGEYNYGLIYWAYPIKVTATLSGPDGSDALYTHDGNIVAATTAGSGSTTTFASNLTVGPATQSVVTLANGGTWFKFQNPLKITSDDISGGTDFVVDLAFNPNGIVTGNQNSVFGLPQLTDSVDNANTIGDYISIPMLDLTPVPHRSSETVQVETYIGTIGPGTSENFDVRIELYSIVQDANHTIYGVNTTPLVNAQTSGAFAGFGKAAFIATNPDGSINLLDWNKTAFVSNLHRQTAVGGQSTVSVSCTLSGSDAATSVTILQGCLAPLTVTFTLTAITEITD